MRQYRIKSFSDIFPGSLTKIATWNIEGMHLHSPAKLFQIIQHMYIFEIGILCIQETHICGAQYFHFEGYLVINSGKSEAADQPEFIFE